jgi:hypothetical protein
MVIRRSNIFFSVAAATAILSGCAAHGPGPFDNPVNLLGAPVSDRVAVESSQRTITITPETRYVNVTSGETVRFIAGAQSFAWSFQTGPTITMFDLNRIAPPGLLTRPIPVYVAPNPLYISNS